MWITFCGAAQTVTGSQFLIEANGQRLLLDCGLYQGSRALSRERNQTFFYPPSEVNAAILTHAHIDHSGNLPNLVKQGYRGPIYATTATADLAGVMLLDSGHIQEQDAAYLNKRSRERRNGHPIIEPLYTIADAEVVADHFRAVEYGQTFEPIRGVTAHMVEGGHILGSAAVILDVKEDGGKRTRLWCSGDIGRRDLALLRDPIFPSGVDVVLMECTYGDIPHGSPETAYHEFIQAVGRTIQRGGKVIIPAFAVGRTQELVYSLNQAINSGELPKIPVFVDSPLAVEASQVFEKHTEYFDDETAQFIHERRHPALEFDSLTYIESVDESKALNERQDPMVIISASGMAETGRILHHLKNNVENPRNTVMIVSYQAPETLGRRILERQPRIKIFGEEYALRSEVVQIDGLSAHAGQDTLVEYALSAKETLKRVILVHGEPGPAGVLRQILLQKGLPRVDYPALHERIEL